MKNIFQYSAILLFTLLSAFPLQAEYFKHLGPEDGLAQSSVMSICQDELGRMWFGTREGLCCYDGGHVTTFRGWLTNTLWIGNNITCIRRDSRGDLYFLADSNLMHYDVRQETFTQLTTGKYITAMAEEGGTIWYMHGDTLFTQTRETNEFTPHIYDCTAGKKVSINCLTLTRDYICVGTTNGTFLMNRRSHNTTCMLPGADIYSIFEDSRDGLWISTRYGGLWRMERDGEPQRVNIPQAQVREITEDNAGNVWIGTFGGLWKYGRDTGQCQLVNIPRYVGGLAHPSIFSLYRDAQGVIWVGSYYGGVNWFDPEASRFTHYNYESNISSRTYYSYIGDMVMDNAGHLWLSTDGGGITCLDRDWNIVRQYCAGNSDLDGLPHNNVKSIAYDHQRDLLYVGMHLGGLACLDLRNNKWRRYAEAGSVIYMVRMRGGRIWVSSRTGVFCIDSATDKLEKIDLPVRYYESFDVAPDGTLYLSWGNNISKLQPGSKQVEDFTPSDGTGTYITRICAADSGVYAATLGGGIYFLDRSGKKTNYNRSTGHLPDDYCYNLSTTPAGRLLVTYRRGVVSFDPQTENTTTIDFMNSFQPGVIMQGCGLLIIPDGRVFVGDNKGITAFTEDIHEEVTGTNLHFTELTVNSRPCLPGDGILKQSLPYTDAIRLPHNAGNITIRYSLSSHYAGLSQGTFRYRLEGFDKQWTETEQSELRYTNLPAGKYVLRLAAAGAETALRITILPAWYATWWAWALYLVLLVGGLYGFIRNRIARQMLRQTEALNREKLAFFTNVSHEFRTPLTLISSHIDLLLQEHSLPRMASEYVRKIRKNTRYLSFLITELLDFRRLEADRVSLTLVTADLKPVLLEAYMSFTDYASQHDISYRADLPEGELPARFDAHLMEKVLFNLLSNAFKYTSAGGTIILHSSMTMDGEVEISVTDTGAGIAPDELSHVFDEFYRGSNAAAKEAGSGLGLAFARRIVEKHDGCFTVQSKEGEGSTFTVILPPVGERINIKHPRVRRQHLPMSPLILAEERTNMRKPPILEEENACPLLLIVEDNAELREALAKLFAPHYRVELAADGAEGLEQVRSLQPDLVVSDILMPRINGVEFCRTVKDDLLLCHIPVILLTALDSPENSIEGFARGADDYITKPFDSRLLLARANNLVRSRQLIRQAFAHTPTADIDLTVLEATDKKLLTNTADIIRRCIDDPELDVPDLCTELGIGRSKLFRKIKALTGMTPSHFITSERLKHAAMLLRTQQELLVNQVGDMCGFASTAYFVKCFKKMYGCTPKEYRQQS